jgi:alanine dehydrogenase
MLFLTEQDVQQLFPMAQAVECLERSFLAQAKDQAINRSRERIFLPEISLHYMAAALPEENVVGMKIYTTSGSAWRFLVLLYDATTGGLLALVEADYLGRLRTGAASGVATKYLAREDASRVGLIGAGRQARTQLEAVARVRKITAVKVFGRDEGRRVKFCLEMREKLNLTLEPAASAEVAARFGEVVITATTSPQPVVHGEWLAPGTHVNAVGANMTTRRELDDIALARAGLIAVDSLEQAKEEAGDLVQGLASLPRAWDGVIELHQVVAGTIPGRASRDEITIFKSSGIALWDVAAAVFIYREALKSGRGKRLEIWGEK